MNFRRGALLGRGDVFEDLAALFVLPFIGLGFASSYLWFMLHPIHSETDLAPIKDAWKRAAQAHSDGKINEQGAGSLLPTLTATVKGVLVTVEARAWREWAYARNVVEYSNQYQTVVTAPASYPNDFRLDISIEERDVPDRGPDFEARFRLTSPNMDLARAWANEAFKAQVMMTTGYTFTLERGRVTAVREGLEHDAAQLRAAMRAVGAMASRGQELLKRWDSTAESLGGTLSAETESWEPDGKTVIDAERHGRHVVIDAVRHGPTPRDVPTRLSTRIRARVDHDVDLSFALHGLTTPHFARYFPRVEDFDLELSRRYILRSPQADRVARRFEPDLCRTVIELSPREICRDRRWVTVSLEGLVDDRRHLTRAVHVATELARPRDVGPYR